MRLTLAVVIFWLILLPPFFTGGACTAEFDREQVRLAQDHRSILTLESAMAYLAARQVPFRVYSQPECRRLRLRLKFVSGCSAGGLIYANVPVQNRICHYYRDSNITVQLKYNDHGNLIEQFTDMNSYKFLELPWIGVTLNWAK